MEIAVSGACGRMGIRVCALVLEEPARFRLVAAIERSDHPSFGKDIGEIAGVGPTGVIVSARLGRHADVLIDFSTPAALPSRIEECLETRTPLLVGTTGLTDSVQAQLANASGFIPCLVSANMSLGANLLAALAARAGRVLGAEYDVELVEAHHRFKKDAPSGTALMIARAIAAAMGRTERDFKCGRGRGDGARAANEIGIHSVRAGDIVGVHSVVMSNLGECIELTHRVHSRDVFARGALRAAEFLAKAKPGMYGMNDMPAFHELANSGST